MVHSTVLESQNTDDSVHQLCLKGQPLTLHTQFIIFFVPYFFQNSVVINFLTEVVSDTTCGFLKHLGLLGLRS